MSMFRSLSLALLASLFVFSISPVVVADDLDAESLLGEWSYESGKKAGVESSEEVLQGTVKIEEGKMSLPGGPDMTFVMKYEIDTDANPTAIDIEIEEGPVPGAKAVGIVKIDDGKLYLCYDPNGQSRPREFESTAENGMHLLVLTKDD